MFLFLVFFVFFSSLLKNSINIFSTYEFYFVYPGLMENDCKAKCIKVITVEVSGLPIGAPDCHFL